LLATPIRVWLIPVYEDPLKVWSLLLARCSAFIFEIGLIIALHRRRHIVVRIQFTIGRKKALVKATIQLVFCFREMFDQS
jgi:hypothetical protein